MQRLNVNQDICPLSEFRARVSSYFKQVQETKRPLVITQHGKGVGVLMGVNEYEEMQDTIELFKNLQKSMAQIKDGNGLEHKTAFEQIQIILKESFA